MKCVTTELPALRPAQPPAGTAPQKDWLRRRLASGPAAGRRRPVPPPAGSATQQATPLSLPAGPVTPPPPPRVPASSPSAVALSPGAYWPGVAVSGPLPARRHPRRAPTGLAGASTGGGSFKALPGVYRPPPSCVCFRSAPTPVDKVTTFLHLRTAPMPLGKVITPRFVHNPGRKLGAKSRAHGSISAAVAGLSDSYNNANLDYL